jgi:hypothetical protein
MLLPFAKVLFVICKRCSIGIVASEVMNHLKDNNS